MSMGITANSNYRRAMDEGKRMKGQWILDAAGEPTDDPAALFAEPPGVALGLGGTEYLPFYRTVCFHIYNP